MWHGSSLLTMRDVDPVAARTLLSKAHTEITSGVHSAYSGDELRGKSVANVFLEDSTRTRVSFSLAAQSLGASVVDLTGSGSSVSKGETLLDTIWTIEAMGVDAIVVRLSSSGSPWVVDTHTACPIINAGDGTHQHPTQALTDALSLGAALGRFDSWSFDGLKVVVVGDVVSSRVARSNVQLLTALGAQVVLVGPPSMAPSSLASLGCSVSSDLDAALDDADAAMMLRIQFERGGGALLASTREYHKCFGMTKDRAREMKQGAVVMHPGPMNRGVEIDGQVADGLKDGPRSLVLDQVRGGVAVRRAVLCEAINGA